MIARHCRRFAVVAGLGWVHLPATFKSLGSQAVTQGTQSGLQRWYVGAGVVPRIECEQIQRHSFQVPTATELDDLADQIVSRAAKDLLMPVQDVRKGWSPGLPFAMRRSCLNGAVIVVDLRITSA
jgi:hypothetical protein